jgi:type I restriction enzyme R subunit
LGRLTKRLQPEDIEKIHALTGTTLQELAQNLLNAIDFDQQTARAQRIAGTDNPDLQTLKEAERQLQQEATQPFTNAELKDLLLHLQRRDKQILDDISIDRVLSKGFSEDQARQTIASFRALMEQHKDEITAFQIAFNKPGDVDLEDLVYRLARAIMPPNAGLTTDKVWNAYQKLEASRVRGAGTKRLLTDIIALIRYTIERETDSSAILEPYRDSVNRRFTAWLAEQERTHQQPFTAEQLWWLERIRDRIAVDLRVEERDFDSAPFNTQGGRLGARRAFSGPQELQTLLHELNERLVA